jgi:hypothetical protein
MAVEAGTRIGRYLIHEYLGQGDLGVVYRACGPSAGSVAIKVLRGLAAAAAGDRFLLLARRLTNVRHPNVAAVLEYGEHNGEPYLIAQHVPNGSLADLLRTTTVGQAAAIWLLRGIAAGIDHAHRCGFVHGALKPPQILLDADDHPFLTDLALAPLRWPRPDGVSVVVPESNAAYAAPELVTGGEPTPAADRYAFAAIAYEVLAGRPPFEGEPHDVMNAQLDLSPPVPSSINPALSARTDDVLLRGLAKNARARWPTCTEMVEALAQSVSGRPARETAGSWVPAVLMAPPAAQPAPAASPGSAAAERPEPLHRRVAWWVIVGAAAFVLLAAAAAAVLLTLARASAPDVVITLSASNVRAGDTIVVMATGLPPNQGGTVQLHSAPEQIASFEADGRGDLRTDVVIPSTAMSGEHAISLCWDDRCRGDARLEVADWVGPTPPAVATPGPILEPLPVPSSDPTTAAKRPRPGQNDAQAHAAPAGPTPAPGSQPPPPQPPAQTPTPRPSRSPTPAPNPSLNPSPHPSPSPSPQPSPTRG